MDKKIRFVSLFPLCENVHLIKDVGMIPYVLHKEYGYDSTIACYKIGDYPYLDTDLRGLKLSLIDEKFNSEILNVCLFLFMNFRKFDILQCYHISLKSIIYLMFFNILKIISFSKGITYLKFDENDLIKKRTLSKKLIFLLKKIKILSVETKILQKYFNSKNLLDGLVNYIPNGFYSSNNKKRIVFSSKENIILTVGRIGSVEKNNEVLLESFKDFAKIYDDWKLELVGPIEKDFQVKIDNFFYENPNLTSRVIFAGSIQDRELLQKKYDKAKIFILTSPMEGFPLVFLEAIQSGCSLISPNFSSAIEVSSNGKYGRLFEIGNYEFLSQEIAELTQDSIKLERNCVEIQDYAYENFPWDKICGDINTLILEKYNKNVT